MNSVIVPRTTPCALALGLCALASGCFPPSLQTHPVDLASIETEGVEISSSSGGFTLRSGEHFRPPFHSNCLGSNVPRLTDSTLVTSAGVAIGMGATHVNVRVPGRDRPLNGLLLFCDVPAAAHGPASRSYRIQVPSSYVEAATGGRMSAVYERVDWNTDEGNTLWYFAWVLWLSDEPIR